MRALGWISWAGCKQAGLGCFACSAPPRLRPSRTHQPSTHLHPHSHWSLCQVNYKNVMKQYSLGPNGAILTSLNLFATRFDQVRCV
jgi:hypothetical protein